MGRGAGGRRWVSWRGSTSRWSGCSRGRCGDFFASTGRASSFWADAGVAARRRRRRGRGAADPRSVDGRRFGGRAGRRERAAKDADMERLRWSAPRGAWPFRLRQAVGCFSILHNQTGRRPDSRARGYAVWFRDVISLVSGRRLFRAGVRTPDCRRPSPRGARRRPWIPLYQTAG